MELNIASFLFEIMLQHTEWKPVFMIIQIFIITYLTYKLLHFVKEYLPCHGIFRPSSISGIKGNPQIVYFSALNAIYNNCNATCPALCGGLQAMMGLCLIYGKNGLFRFLLLFKPCVIFFKAEAVEAVLSSPELINKSGEYIFIRPAIGNGLVTSLGTDWRKQRKLLTPTFHFSILDDCIPIFQKQANVLISTIKSRIHEPWIDIAPLSHLCALDIICETAMGVTMNFQIGGNCDYSNALHEIEGAVMYRALRPWLYPDIIFNLTTVGKKFKSNVRLFRGLSKKILKQKIESINNKKCNPTSEIISRKYSVEKKMQKPFLELLLEHHLKDPSFTEENIIEQVDTFMLAGQDTTAAAMSWTLYCLGIYPEVQKQVHEELDAIFGDEKNMDISREILSHMRYLECVIKETMRLYPVIPLITRENDREFKVLNHTVEKGTICVILFTALHRDPEVFPDPEKFDPDRFLPENCAGRHPYAYTPFSAGPRNCIGQKFAMMEAKTILACILAHFRVKSLDSRDKVLFYPNITLRNVYPMRLSFELR
ncbi:cytochrome P450 4C1-like [Argiope bruennichi]|uniref:cytochrome P450 4C1-like n=1 Tax=Argiope bruennichi TaxID=94029 RepID=UPI0024957BAB|nr:cytochrome P450 4C1-like [Argiope bruennichi]